MRGQTLNKRKHFKKSFACVKYLGNRGFPRAVRVTVTDDTLSVDLDDGRTIAVPIGWFPRLAYGTAPERANVQIAGGGFGLHWPDLDEDIGVEAFNFNAKAQR